MSEKVISGQLEFMIARECVHLIQAELLLIVTLMPH
jgi:hypothetical protein